MHRGHYVPPSDPETLVEAIDASVGKTERRRRLGEAAQRRAQTKRRRAATRCAMPIVEDGAVAPSCQAVASSLPAPTSRRATTGFSGAVRIAAVLAWSDVRHRYTRSLLGPFWMSIRLTIAVAMLGFVIRLFSDGNTLSRLPMLALSLTAWAFLNGAILDAMTALRRSSSLMKDRALPPVIFLLQCTFRHALFGLHNACVPLLLWLILTPMEVTGVVAALLGLLLFITCAVALSLVLGTLAMRFRDVKPIIESALPLAFVSSPVMWPPEMIDPDSAFMRLNPLTHLFAVWREPLVADHVAMTSEIYVLVCSAALVLASLLTVGHLRRATFWI